MPRIDFYVIDASDDKKKAKNLPQNPRERVLCQVVEKAFKQKQRGYIQVETAEQVQFIDDLLWTFRSISFVVHAPFSANAEENDLKNTPMFIGVGAGPDSHRDVLFTLCQNVPEHYADYQRVIEVIDEASKQAGRQRFKTYREAGNAIETHKI